MGSDGMQRVQRDPTGYSKLLWPLGDVEGSTDAIRGQILYTVVLYEEYIGMAGLCTWNCKVDF